MWRGTQVCVRWRAAHDEKIFALRVPHGLVPRELPRIPARFPKVRRASACLLLRAPLGFTQSRTGCRN